MESWKTTNRILMIVSLAVFLLTGFGSLAAAESPAGNVAIKGYDPVAYFAAGKALKGKASISFAWHGMTWHFATAENRELFATSPEKYAPQYDGYCAWAMTESRKAVTDPEIWKIVDGRLYLNCSAAAYEKWANDIPGNIKKANENWLKLKSGN